MECGGGMCSGGVVWDRNDGDVVAFVFGVGVAECSGWRESASGNGRGDGR